MAKMSVSFPLRKSAFNDSSVVAFEETGDFGAATYFYFADDGAGL